MAGGIRPSVRSFLRGGCRSFVPGLESRLAMPVGSGEPGNSQAPGNDWTTFQSGLHQSDHPKKRIHIYLEESRGLQKANKSFSEAAPATDAAGRRTRRRYEI